MIWILAAAALAYLTKLSGYLLPERLLDRPGVTKVTGAMTIGLLASLIALNGFSGGVDARLVSLGVAIAGFWAKFPFLVVVIGAAGAAAAVRAMGWG